MHKFYIACQIELGAFTNERTFEIELSENINFQGETTGKLVGTAHVSHLQTSEQQPFNEGEPPYNEKVGGFVQCKTIRQLSPELFQVEVPSADIIHVSKDALISAD